MASSNSSRMSTRVAEIYREILDAANSIGPFREEPKKTSIHLVTTSANRWHLEIRLDDPKQVDRELKSWLADAMRLSASSPARPASSTVPRPTHR
jgi:hypothetical protein